MYSGRQKTLSLLPTQIIALAFGIALFVLLLFLAGKSAFERAQETAPGFAHGLTHGADRELNDGSGSSGGGSVGLAHRSGTVPSQNATAYQAGTAANYPTPSIGPLPDFGGGSGQAVFAASEGEKEAAQASLVPLHELIENIHRFDSTVWSGENRNANGGNPSGDPARLLDGLEAQAALVSHPLRFPEPLQNDAMDTTRELQIYLETVRSAGINAPKTGDTPALQAAAHRHLENGARLLARLDGLAGGGGSAGASSPPTRTFGSDLP